MRAMPLTSLIKKERVLMSDFSGMHEVRCVLAEYFDLFMTIQGSE